MTRITVFNDNVMVFEFDSSFEFDTTRRAMCVGNYSFYNSCYVHSPDQFRQNWGRMDGTPTLIEDVPKETRMLAMLMGLST